MKKLSFAVYLPGKKEFTGGHVVLHKLVKILSDLGQEVWVNCEPMFPCKVNMMIKENGSWNLPKKESYNIVVLYPETVKGNPFRGKHISRWILYHTNEDIEKTWEDSDEYFFFTKGFNTFRDRQHRMLSIVDAKLDVFFNQGMGDKRSGYCHINKKKFPKDEKMLEFLGSTDLLQFIENGGFGALAKEMNKYEYFVTYDDATYYSIAAAMCGCRSVIINPDPNVTPEEYRKKYHMSMYGVAYGWNDLKHADMTRDMVRDFMKNFEKQSIKCVQEFISFWESSLKTK